MGSFFHELWRRPSLVAARATPVGYPSPTKMQIGDAIVRYLYCAVIVCHIYECACQGEKRLYQWSFSLLEYCLVLYERRVVVAPGE